MPRRSPPQPLQPGPLTRQTADAWNGWAQEVNVLLGGFHADPPLNVTQDAGGVSFRIDTIPTTGADPDTNETITGDWLVQGSSGDPASITFGSFSQLVIPTTLISAPTVGSIAWVNNTQYVWNGSVWVLVGGGVVTHVTWGTDQTDYALPDNTRVLVVDLSANVVLRSIVGGYDARHLWIVNKNNSFTLTLGNEDVAGAATARMRLRGAANLALDAIYEGVGLAYSGTDSRWYCLDEEAGGGAPAVSKARAYRTTTQSISSSAETNVLFNLERWDTDSYHDTSSNTDRLTVPSAGHYQLGFTVTMQDAAYRSLNVNIKYTDGGGTSYVSRSTISFAADTLNGLQTVTIPGEWEAAAGGYFTASVLQINTGSAARNVTAAEFWIHKVG